MAKKYRPLIVDDEIDLVAVWQRVKSGWLIIMIFTIIFTSVFVGVGFFLPPKYLTEAIIKVPSQWDIETETLALLFERYANKEEFSSKGKISIKQLGSTDQSLRLFHLSVNGSDIEKSKVNIQKYVDAINKDEDIVNAKKYGLERLNEEVNNTNRELEDAYKNKKAYESLLSDGNSSLIVGANPVDISNSILQLEMKKYDLNKLLEKSKELIFDLSPASDGQNRQISKKILAVVGLLVGGGLGVIVSVVRKVELETNSK